MKKNILDQTMLLRAVILVVRAKSHFITSMNFKICLSLFEHVGSLFRKFWKDMPVKWP